MRPDLGWALLASGILAGSSAAQAPFTEEGLPRGLAYFTVAIPEVSHGFGVMQSDLDGDHAPDAVAIGGFENRPGVFANSGVGTFSDVSAGNGIPAVPVSSGVMAFDYDGDGDLDLYISSFGDENVLARNDGAFQFTSVGHLLGVDDPGLGAGCAAADIDGDGWQDLHLANYGDPDRFYRNLGGTFEDVAEEMGLNDPWRGLQSMFFDLDRDGDLDLYVSNDKKDPDETVMHNRLYKNVGGFLGDISDGSGTDVNIYSMGVAVGDFNGSGLPDLYPTNRNLEPNPMLINQGNGLFRDLTGPMNVESNRTGWGAVFFDYDNDTNADLYVCNTLSASGDPRDRLYVHGGSFPCVDIAPSVALASPLNSYTAGVGDVDDDGDLDILTGQGNNWVQLFINHEGETRNWVKFRVVGFGPNKFAVGATVDVQFAGKTRYREVMTGGNTFKSQNDLTLHFGLGSATLIDRAIVSWPGGRTLLLEDLPVNRTYVVRPDLEHLRPPTGTVEVEVSAN